MNSFFGLCQIFLRSKMAQLPRKKLARTPTPIVLYVTEEPTFSKFVHLSTGCTAIANRNSNPLHWCGYSGPWLQRPLAIAGRHRWNRRISISFPRCSICIHGRIWSTLLCITTTPCSEFLLTPMRMTLNGPIQLKVWFADGTPDVSDVPIV